MGLYDMSTYCPKYQEIVGKSTRFFWNKVTAVRICTYVYEWLFHIIHFICFDLRHKSLKKLLSEE